MNNNTNAVELTPEQLQARIKELESQLNAKNSRALSAKVSGKGAVSVYGLGRFPVTLYKTQWHKLADFMPTLKTFMEANNDKLAVKE